MRCNPFTPWLECNRKKQRKKLHGLSVLPMLPGSCSSVRTCILFPDSIRLCNIIAAASHSCLLLEVIPSYISSGLFLIQDDSFCRPCAALALGGGDVWHSWENRICCRKFLLVTTIREYWPPDNFCVCCGCATPDMFATRCQHTPD